MVKGDGAADSRVDSMIEVLDAELGSLVVVLNDEPSLGLVGEPLKIETEAIERRLLVTVCAADVDVDRRVVRLG